MEDRKPEGRRRIVRESENKLLVLQQLAEKWQEIELQTSVNCIDAAYYMYSLPPGIQLIRLTNCNMELNRIFVKELQNVQKLQLINANPIRKRPLNQNESRCLSKLIPELRSLTVDALPISPLDINNWMEGFHRLNKLYLYQHNNLGDETIKCIAQCEMLKELGLGGKPDEYNRMITEKGLNHLTKIKKSLRILKLRFIYEVNNDFIRNTCQQMCQLEQLQIRRNCFDSSEDFTDQSFRLLGNCKKITILSLVYFRGFEIEFTKLIPEKFPNLTHLCLQDSPLYQDVTCWSTMKYLKVINMGGDSWVRQKALSSLSRLRYLQTLYLGHFEHGETSCQQIVASYPPQGIFIEKLFENAESFPGLQQLYLQQCCTLTFWLDVRINRLRPNLKIFYRARGQFQ